MTCLRHVRTAKRSAWAFVVNLDCAFMALAIFLFCFFYAVGDSLEKGQHFSPAPVHKHVTGCSGNVELALHSDDTAMSNSLSAQVNRRFGICADSGLRVSFLLLYGARSQFFLCVIDDPM